MAIGEISRVAVYVEISPFMEKNEFFSNFFPHKFPHKRQA
jgi:hypothetical protein